MRDPRQNPKPGDVLVYGGDTRLVTDVRSETGGLFVYFLVTTQRGSHTGRLSLYSWECSTRGDAVVCTADAVEAFG